MLHLLPEIRAKLNTDSAWRERKEAAVSSFVDVPFSLLTMFCQCLFSQEVICFFHNFFLWPLTHYLNTTGQILIDFALVSSGVLIDTTASGQDTEGLIWETHAPPDSHSSSHWENMEISIWSAIKTYSSETNPDHIRTDVNETWWLLLQKDCGGTVVQRCLCSLSFACWHSDGKVTRINLSFPHLLSILKAVQLKKSFSLTGSNPLDPGRDTRPVAV